MRRAAETEFLTQLSNQHKEQLSKLRQELEEAKIEAARNRNNRDVMPCMTCGCSGLRQELAAAKAEARDAFTRGMAFSKTVGRVAHGGAVDDEVERARSTLQLGASDDGAKGQQGVQ